MMKSFRRGLVVGKFCPLHRGHEWLIHQAMHRCDDVVILSYTDLQLRGYEAETRARWLGQRFSDLTSHVLSQDSLLEMSRVNGLESVVGIPSDAASADDHRHFVAWLCLNLIGMVDAVFTSETYGDGFADVLAQRFGHPVTHVCVDLPRQTVPVSGIEIRQNPWAYRQYLAPEVLASFVKRIALLGAESTGKSTLSIALARHLNTVFVPEYGRTRWEETGGKLEYADLLRIAEIQVAQEVATATRANEWLVCDTTPLTTLFYCLDLFGHAPQMLHELAHRSYDMTVLCMSDFAFVQDGTRQGPEFQQRQQSWYINQLSHQRIEYNRALGSVAERVAALSNAIRGRFGR